MKKRWSLLLALLTSITLVVSACGSGETNNASPDSGSGATETQEKVKIRFSHIIDENSPKGKAANLFRDLVHERLGDRVAVEVFPNSQLFDDATGLEALEAGNLEMMAPSTSQLIGMDPKMEIFMFPFLFKDMEAAIAFSNSDYGKKLFSGLEKYNIKVLDTWSAGDMQLSYTHDKPILMPEDLKGVKFRVMSGGILADKFELLGASATVIPFSETYLALQQGTVDGYEGTYNNIETQKFHEVQTYITESSHIPATYSWIVNKSFWDGLPDDLRGQLEEIAKEVTAQEVAWTDELNEESKKKIQEYGKTEIHVLTDEQRQAFIDALQPLYEQYEDKIGKEYIDYARSLE
ncbi:DctP family TRAP transporter solute-binding subunit [Brevibacillus marinus]|uniref:DctP family TRAP transporter solute-binding subunit n=1 Tax=Brevibacillus marinus TaxID=2496837 RepID=UPI0013DF4B02|nr:DctP family TRAP transporter solute-binding subunit [Brevibacillus marinus]